MTCSQTHTIAHKITSPSCSYIAIQIRIPINPVRDNVLKNHTFSSTLYMHLKTQAFTKTLPRNYKATWSANKASNLQIILCFFIKKCSSLFTVTTYHYLLKK